MVASHLIAPNSQVGIPFRFEAMIRRFLRSNGVFASLTFSLIIKALGAKTVQFAVLAENRRPFGAEAF